MVSSFLTAQRRLKPVPHSSRQAPRPKHGKCFLSELFHISASSFLQLSLHIVCFLGLDPMECGLFQNWGGKHQQGGQYQKNNGHADQRAAADQSAQNCR